MASVPVTLFNPDEAEDAFRAFSALRRAAQSEPALLDNKYFRAFQDTAYARFLLNFEAMQ